MWVFACAFLLRLHFGKIVEKPHQKEGINTKTPPFVVQMVGVFLQSLLPMQSNPRYHQRQKPKENDHTGRENHRSSLKTNDGFQFSQMWILQTHRIVF